MVVGFLGILLAFSALGGPLFGALKTGFWEVWSAFGPRQVAPESRTRKSLASEEMGP
jgi:hypothetical protein